MFNTLKFIIKHPLNKSKRFSSVMNCLKWQIGSRLVSGPVAVPFVNNSRLLVSPGMTGATGNIYCGLHEFEDMAFALHLLREGNLFVDVGANIGSYTILAGSGVGAKCISIEPIPETFQSLMKNINLNDIRHLVNAINIGIGRANGILRFTSAMDTTNHVAESNDSTAIAVNCRTLDDVVESQKPTLIKIDVEGFETNVIKGATRVLSQDSLSAIIMELNGSGNRYGFDEDALHKEMLDYGFATFFYSPFSRRLVSLNMQKSQSGNTLYVRNSQFVQDRLAGAKSFHVFGQSI